MKFRIFYLIIIIFIQACSTKKNTALTRGYHNLTAHYNVYFNGNESFKEGVKALEDATTDDYSEILMVFPDSKKGSESTVESQMKRAIEKGTKLIKLHSIRKKPKPRKDDNSVYNKNFMNKNEYNKWVDNAYLLIGKANVLKDDFYQAIQSFDYIFREFTPGPEYYEAQLWKVRAYIELNDLANAKIILTNYNPTGSIADKLYPFFAAIKADYFIRKKEYSQAIPFLKSAAEGAPNKFRKIRYYFILAQLYQKVGEYANSAAAYAKVIKSNPPYEVSFKAKVNRAYVMFAAEGLEAVKKETKKLFRDKRNLDFYDQIYYALAKAYYAEKMEDEAIDNFNKSITASINDNHQKGLSFYELGQIYFKHPEYRPAFVNIDSALINLNQDFSQLSKIQIQHEKLKMLIENIDIVEKEDSLQKVAAMPEAERNALIDKLIAEEKKRAEEELKKQQQRDEFADNTPYDPYFNSNSRSLNNNNNKNSNGKWYFYSPGTVAMGKSEFVRKWGRRKLEDNWRRKDKSAVDILDNIDEEPELNFDNNLSNKADSTKKVTEKIKKDIPAGKQKYISELPLDAESLETSNNSIMSSLMNIGLIYKDELNNIPYAIETFKELLSRFPKSKYTENALMNIYLCYQQIDNKDKMAVIKNRLDNDFPNGEFTKFLNDPNYFEKRWALKNKIDSLYRETYKDYLNNKFTSPALALAEANKLDNKNELLPKFKFLTGLAEAKMGNNMEFEKQLNEVVEKYPNNEVTPIAKKILSLYSDGRKPIKGENTSSLADARNKNTIDNSQNDIINNNENASGYKINYNGNHTLIIAINKDADINRLRYNVADYNFSKFLINDYEMSNNKLPDGTVMITVTGFNNRSEGMDYFYSIRENKNIFKVNKLKKYDLFIINDDNLKYLISSGDIKTYKNFFFDNYMSLEAYNKIEQLDITKKLSKLESSKENTPKESNNNNSNISDTDMSIKKKGSVKEAETQKNNIQKADDKNIENKETDNNDVINKEVDNKQTDKKEDNNKQIEDKEIDKKKVENKDAEIKESDKKIADNKTNTEETDLSTQEKTNTDSNVEQTENSVFIKSNNNNIVAIVFKKGRIDINKLTNKFRTYTLNVFKLKTDATNKTLEDGFVLLKLSGFKNRDDAKKYISTIKKDFMLIRDISRTKRYIWAISEDNLSKINNQNDIEEFDKWYKNN